MIFQRLVEFVEKFFLLKRTSWHEYLCFISLKLHTPQLAHVIETILYKNTMIWEPRISKFLSNTSGNLFVDVGACYGRYSLLLGKRYRWIIAIDPSSKNVGTIKSNIRYAHLLNVEVVECAVSDKNGFTDLYLGSHDDWHTLIHGNGPSIKVRTSTLASILKGREADLIKVDVEGAEFLVLKGAEPVVDKIRSWIVEFHLCEQTKLELEQWFSRHSYSFKWLEKNHIYAWRVNYGYQEMQR